MTKQIYKEDMWRLQGDYTNVHIKRNVYGGATGTVHEYNSKERREGWL